MFTVAIIFAILLGLIPGAIAQSKGRSFIGWWFFGTMLFIVALPCAILVSRVDQGPTPGVSRKCPHCAELIKSEARVCRFCGRDVEPQANPYAHLPTYHG